MIKVLYDHQTFSLQDYGGISKIFSELLKPSADDEVVTELSILWSNNTNLNGTTDIKVRKWLSSYNLKYTQQLLYTLNKAYSIGKLKTQQFTIFHPTYYDPYFLKHIKSKPFVLTFHDLTHERLASQYPVLKQDKLTYFGKRNLIENANKIIAVSHATKKDIVNYYGISENQIEVIYPANSLPLNQCIETFWFSADPYVLFVGNRGLYKNFIFFIHAMSSLLKTDLKLKVVCAGGGKFTQVEVNILKQLNIQDQVLQQSFYTASALQSLYSRALCFVFPSLYEGFGLPLLEAFSCGCPVAASNRSSLPEVGGNAAIYFNPEDAASIENTVASLLENEDLRKEKIVNGFKRLSLFSWNDTRRKTYDLYKSLV